MDKKALKTVFMCFLIGILALITRSPLFPFPLSGGGKLLTQDVCAAVSR